MVSLSLKVRVASDRASLTGRSGSARTSFVISSLIPFTAFSHTPSFQWASPGMMSRKIWCLSQYSSTALLRKVPSGSSRRLSGSPKYWHQLSWKTSKNWEAPTWYFFPSPRTLPSRNLEPSSMASRNWCDCPVVGCSQVPMSAATVDHFGGKGSKVETGLGFCLWRSTQTGHSKDSATLMTSGLTPLLRSACNMCLMGPCPVAECSK